MHVKVHPCVVGAPLRVKHLSRKVTNKRAINAYNARVNVHTHPAVPGKYM